MTWTGEDDALLEVSSRIAAAMVSAGRDDWEHVVTDSVYAARLLINEVERVRREGSGPPTQAFRKPDA